MAREDADLKGHGIPKRQGEKSQSIDRFRAGMDVVEGNVNFVYRQSVRGPEKKVI